MLKERKMMQTKRVAAVEQVVASRLAGQPEVSQTTYLYPDQIHLDHLLNICCRPDEMALLLLLLLFFGCCGGGITLCCLPTPSQGFQWRNQHEHEHEEGRRIRQR